SPTLGIVVSLVVIIVTREVLGTEAFNAWGWRIPFLLSLLMVAIAIYIRLQLQETPIFQAIKAKGQTAANPWREAFWSQNIRYVLVASVVVLGEGGVWYSGQFWALYLIQQVQKPHVLHPAVIRTAADVNAQEACVSMSQSLGRALVYPISVPAVACLLCLFLMPDTRKSSIWQPAAVRAGDSG